MNIIVVDDFEDNAEMLAALLEDFGCQVRTAHDGAGAIDLVDKERPDVVLLDVGLPGMDGFEVAAEMRRRFGAGFRIVALSGFSSQEYRVRAQGSGIDVFVTKPVQAAQLEQLLHRLGSTGAEESPR